MPKRIVYVRDSRGRFARTGKKTYARGWRGTKPRGKLEGKPVGKSQLPLVERYPGGSKNAKKLQAKLTGEHAQKKLIRVMNHYNGGWTPTKSNKGNGTYFFVARNPKTGTAIGVMQSTVWASSGKGSGRSVSVDELFKATGRKGTYEESLKANKGTGKNLIVAGAKLAKSRDLGKGYRVTDYNVSNMLEGAKKFYASTGANVSKNSSTASWTPLSYKGNRGVAIRRDRLAGKRVRIKIMNAPNPRRKVDYQKDYGA